MADRVLVGLGVVVISAGAALGWIGATPQGRSEALAATESALPVAGPLLPDPAAGDAAYSTRAWMGTWADAAPEGESAGGSADAAAEEAETDDPDDSGAPADPGAAAQAVLSAGAVPAPDSDSAGDLADALEGAGALAPESGGQAGSVADDLRNTAPRDAAQIRARAPMSAPKLSPVLAKRVVRGTYAYGPIAKRNEMDVYRKMRTLADPTLRLPTVVFIHGGSWTGGSKMNAWAILAPFVNAGYNGVAINYRLSGDAPWPAPREDVVSAIEALKNNSALYNVDPDNIVLIGSSAGAHLAAAAATQDQVAHLVKGFVALSAPMDMYKVLDATTADQKLLAGKVLTKLMRCAPEACSALYDDATPANHLDAADAPSLLIASQNDWVSWRGARDYSVSSNAVGVSSDFWLIRGDAHGRAVWPEVSQRVVDWVDDLVQHG